MQKPSILWTLILGLALGVCAAPVLAQGDADPGSAPADPGPGDAGGRSVDDRDVGLGSVDDGDFGGSSAPAEDPGPEVDDRDEPGSVSSGDIGSGTGGGESDDTDDVGATGLPDPVGDGDGHWVPWLPNGRDG